MSKPDQLLEIKPPTELRFRGPFTDVVTSELTLSNPSDKIISFSIKTTTPRRYCVRPNSGIMIPNQNVIVSVMLQPFDFDPNEKYNHKFMIQSIVIPKADIDLEAMWKASDITAIMDTKLVCVFEWSANQAPAPATQDQLLAIKPPTELRFRGPFTNAVTSELTLSNPSDKFLYFRIKTTAPRRYCVRPNSGIMIPNQNITVAVMLQPFDFDPNEENNHTFMVQSIVKPKTDIDLEAVWKASDIAAIMDTKLKCVFEWPANQARAPASQAPAPASQAPAPASQDQLLAIKPPTELRFLGRFTDVVTSELTLSNPSDKIICFKIQTTAPRCYCVRPNSGIMIPNQNITVAVMLQPFDFDPNEKYNHKFMVQSIVIPKADIDLEAVWKASDIAAIMDTKLKCVFEWPSNQAPAPATQDQLLAIKPPTELRFREVRTLLELLQKIGDSQMPSGIDSTPAAPGSSEGQTKTPDTTAATDQLRLHDQSKNREDETSECMEQHSENSSINNLSDDEQETPSGVSSKEPFDEGPDTSDAKGVEYITTNYSDFLSYLALTETSSDKLLMLLVMKVFVDVWFRSFG